MSILGLNLPLCLWCLLALSASSIGAHRTSINFSGREQMLPEEENAILNSLRTIDDCLNFFNMTTSRIHSRIQGEHPQAGCTPELTTVPLDISVAGSIMFFPTCVRIERCGGCCLSPHHTCQPIHVDTVLVNVMKLELASTDINRNRRRRVRNATPDFLSVDVDRHMECECRCRLQSGDCNLVIHTYDPHQCSCVCKDINQERACVESSNHFWNSQTCECLCRNEEACSSGQVFSHKMCSCHIPDFDYGIFLGN